MGKKITFVSQLKRKNPKRQWDKVRIFSLEGMYFRKGGNFLLNDGRK